MDNVNESEANTAENRTSQRVPSVTFGGVHMMATPDVTGATPEKEDGYSMKTSSDTTSSGILRKSPVPLDRETSVSSDKTTKKAPPNQEMEMNSRKFESEEFPMSPVRPTNRSKIEKSFVNVVVIGHADSGKSTLIGHLVYLCHGVDKGTMNRLAREADLASFKFAWVMDKLRAERQRGLSISSKLRRFQTPSHIVVIIDSPGHRDYVHNMITGASQADVALLVVSAEKGEFEQGMRRQGQTREHLQLVYSIGVKQLIVVVNKMETTTPPYSETRYTNIITVLTSIARRVGYDVDDIVFLPISAYDGDNLVTKSPNMPWYHMWRIKRDGDGVGGHTLLEAIEHMDVPVRLSQRPLRMPVHSVYKLGDVGIVAAGRVHTGSITPHSDVMFAPQNIQAKVRAVQVFRELMTEVRSGDNVGIQLENLSLKDVKRGDVCGAPGDNPPTNVSKFTAQIMVLNHPGQIRMGYTPILSVHTASVACRFAAITERCDRRTGETEELSPAFLLPGQVGVVEMVPMKPLCVECFFEYPSLGRIVIRDLKQTVAVGVVIEINDRSLRSGGYSYKGQGRYDSSNVVGDSQLDNLNSCPDPRPVTAGELQIHDPRSLTAGEIQIHDPLPATAGEIQIHDPRPVTAGEIQIHDPRPVTAGEIQIHDPLPATTGEIQINDPLPVTAGEHQIHDPRPVTAGEIQIHDPRPVTACEIQIHDP